MKEKTKKIIDIVFTTIIVLVCLAVAFYIIEVKKPKPEIPIKKGGLEWVR